VSSAICGPWIPRAEVTTTDGGRLSASKGSMPVVRAWIHAILGIAATSSGDTSCAFAMSTVASGARASASLCFEVAKICRAGNAWATPSP
jgi:hypothetical protein